MRRVLGKTGLGMGVLSDEGVGLVQRLVHQLARTGAHVLMLSNQMFQVRQIVKIVAALRNIAYIELGPKINPE